MNRANSYVCSVIVAFLGATACGAWPEPATDPAVTHPIPAFTILPAKTGTAYERFLVTGDTGTGRPDHHAVAAAMVERAAAEAPSFVLMLGDNFYEDGVESVEDPQWKTKFEDVYAAPSLQIPFYAVLGNHDHRGNIRAQIEYAYDHEHWRMPSSYYTFSRKLSDGTTIDFFALDTTPIEKRRGSGKDQVKWLDKRLKKSKAQWKIVIGHHPLYSHGMHGTSKAMIDQLEPLFVRHKVDLYLAGHDHTLEMLKPVKGVHYVVAGAGAGADKAYEMKWTDDAFYAATLGGFTALRVSRAELLVEFVRLDAKTQYAHTITK